jgi:2-C-methyl-D-erythritol 4-phosphate cytidylyltransferase
VTCWGVVVAAGCGERFGTAKHGVTLRGRYLWEWARDSLLVGGARGVVLVGPVLGGVPGGERRRDSVFAGLAALPAEASHVLVHDAARPLASPDLARRVIERLLAGDVDAVIPVLTVADTVKRIEGDRVAETVERNGLALAQTPQGFRLSTLLAAHAGSPQDAGDDAALIERMGGTVAVIDGEARNIKITFPADLAFAEALLL